MDFKKIGENINLLGLVIHQVNKNSNSTIASIKYATKLLDTGETERYFIGRVFRSYFDNSKPIYGVFADENPKFKNSLSSYLTEESDFFSFSKDSASNYQSIIKQIAPATGGFLIFAHFHNTDRKNDYMLVMTTNNKDGFVVSEEDLTLKDIKNLDLTKIDVACMINISKWSALEKEEDKDIVTYLSFARGNKDVSKYFMTFIDCDNKTTKSESTQRLINALTAFLKDSGYETDHRIKKRNEVYQYCSDCLTQNKEIKLSTISHILNPDDPSAFESFAGDEKFQVSAIINGDKQKLKTIKYIRYKSEDMTIEFDASLIKEEKIIFDRKKKQLIFKNVPESLINQIPE